MPVEFPVELPKAPSFIALELLLALELEDETALLPVAELLLLLLRASWPK
jgi:hypothetical protein